MSLLAQIGVSALGSIGQSAISALAGSSASHYQLKNARSLMDYQAEHQKELFDYQNAYNTASKQRERLEAAGYNPYALLEGAGQSAASLPSPPAVDSSIDNGRAAMAEQFGRSFNEAVQNSLAISQNQGVNLDNDIKRVDVKYAELDKLTQIQERQQTIHKLIADTDMSRAQTKRYLRELDILEQSADAIIDKNKSDAKTAKAQAFYAYAQQVADLNYKQAQIALANSSVNVNKQQAEYLAGQVRQIPYMIANLIAEHDKINSETLLNGVLKELQGEMRDNQHILNGISKATVQTQINTVKQTLLNLQGEFWKFGINSIPIKSIDTFLQNLTYGLLHPFESLKNGARAPFTVDPYYKKMK